MNALLCPPSTSLLGSPAVRAGLEMLLEGYEYAQDLGGDLWNFAVPLEHLLHGGCSINTLRWLVRRGFILEDAHRGRRPKARPGAAEFPANTCFVLTELGAATVAASPPALPRAAMAPGLVAKPRPAWQSNLGELRFDGQLVKRFRKAASNQWLVLDAFEQQGWPARLEDPLPPPRALNVSLKQRLHDTIKNLNRGHEQALLRFCGAEFGRAVAWRSLV